VQTSIRLILAALIISGVTYAAAGAPSPSPASIQAGPSDAPAAPAPPSLFALNSQ